MCVCVCVCVCSTSLSAVPCLQDYRLGVGISSIEMNVGNVKDTDRRSFDLTTPYRIFRYTHTHSHYIWCLFEDEEACARLERTSALKREIWRARKNKRRGKEV